MSVTKSDQDVKNDLLEQIRKWITKDDDEIFKTGTFTKQLMPHLTVDSVNPNAPSPSITFSFTCQEEHTNRLGNLHGGAQATLFDCCTTLALVLVGKPGFWQFLGVTRSLNVSYFRPVPKGEVVTIEVEALQVGKRMCTLRGVMKRKRDGAIFSIAEHLKANIDPEPQL